MTRRRAFFLALIAAFVTLAIPTKAQEKEASQKTAPEERFRSKVIPLKYVDPARVVKVLGPFGATMVADDKLKVITVAGNPSAVDAVEEAIQKLDVPPPPARSVDITAYILLGTRQSMESTNLPKELDEVVNQLKRVLSYQGFRLLDSTIIRTVDGEPALVSGGGGSQGQKADFHFKFGHAHIIPEGKVATIRINDLDFVYGAVGRDQAGSATTTIHTDIDLPEGLKVVVGKTSFDSPDNALVLVLTAKVVN